MFFNSCCCRRCCCPRPTPPLPPIPPTPPFVRPSVVGAQFSASVLTAVAPGAILPLTTTTFNNAPTFISNNNGTITLTGPGLYYIDYGVQVDNTTEAADSVSISLNVNSVSQEGSSSTSSLPAGEITTLNNSALVYISSGVTSTITLTVTSTGTLSYFPNVVVTKLS